VTVMAPPPVTSVSFPFFTMSLESGSIMPVTSGIMVVGSTIETLSAPPPLKVPKAKIGVIVNEVAGLVEAVAMPSKRKCEPADEYVESRPRHHAAQLLVL